MDGQEKERSEGAMDEWGCMDEGLTGWPAGWSKEQEVVPVGHL